MCFCGPRCMKMQFFSIVIAGEFLNKKEVLFVKYILEMISELVFLFI